MNVSFVSDENFFLRNMFPFISGTYVLTQYLIYSSKLTILVGINLHFPNDYNSQFNFICRILISIHFYDNVNVPWRIAMNICNILAYLLTRHHISISWHSWHLYRRAQHGTGSICWVGTMTYRSSIANRRYGDCIHVDVVGIKVFGSDRANVGACLLWELRLRLNNYGS
jgi:hypothetical protein